MNGGIVRLDELRVAAREQRAELMLAMGSVEDAVAALQAVVAEHPEREHARGLLMQALYQGGRHTDALATFQAAADVSGAPSALALTAWTTGEITASTDPGQAERHLRRAIVLARSAGSRLVAALAEVSLAALHARNGDADTALGHYRRGIPEWRQADALTPQWVTMRTLIDLLTRVGASRDAAPSARA